MVNKSFKKYAQNVVTQINCSQEEKRRIKEDIVEMLVQKSSGNLDSNPVELMGEVSEVAAEFRENLSYSTKGDKPIEYISDFRILGLPLYHIIFQYQVKKRNTASKQLLTAKGIFAFGPRAFGIVSIGGISIGLISLGGIAIGVLSFAGLAFGVMSAIGGVAIAADLAVGGVAIASNLAYGAVAISREIAIGAMTHAKLMLYSQEYLQPRNLDEGGFKAFRFDYKIDFLKEFDLLYQHFGGLKKLFVHKFLG